MAALLCPECGNEVSQGAKFCNKCGFPLGQKFADITFGRSQDCNIRFESPRVSRKHARAILVDGNWFLRDEGSRNGSFVNDEKLMPNQWHKIPIGAIVRLADVLLKLLPEGWQNFETGEWVWRQKVEQPKPIAQPSLRFSSPTPHPNSCPYCRTTLPKSFLLAFCPTCGFSLRWLEVAQQQTFQVNIRRPQTLRLNLEVKGIGNEPLEVTVRSLAPERLKFEVDGLETEMATWSLKAGEKLSLTLLPNLPSDTEQPCDCTLLVQSIFAPSKPQTERPQWQPSELVEERKVTVRLEPIFVKLEWQPSLLLFSERRIKQELKLINLSPIAVSGAIDCPNELDVQPLQWHLKPNESLNFKVSARKTWDEGKGLILKAQPEEGDPIECYAFWFGQEQETLLVPDVVVGIDFGTSKSAIAFKRHDSEDVELLKVQGKETVPSILLFLPDHREPLIGPNAHARLGDPTALPIQGIKVLLRTNLQVEWQGRTWTPQQLAQRFLKFLKQRVDENFGDDNVCVKRFELSLPVLENERDYEEQKKVSLQAAEEAGMKWVRVWWEPVCAAVWVLHRWQDYASELPLPKPDDWILVLDWGAGTLEAALLIYEQNRPPFFQLPPFFGIGLEKGGNFLDWQLTCEFLERVNLMDLLQEAKELGWKQFHWKGSQALRQLADAARDGKEKISQDPQPMKYTVGNARRLLTDPIFANLDTNLPIMTTDSLDKIVKQVLDELKAELDSHLGNDIWNEIDYAFIFGGSGQMEIVGNIVGEWLRRIDRVIQLRDRDAILAVAFGAAVLSDVKVDVLPLGLSLQVGNETIPLLQAGDSITQIQRRFQVPLSGLNAKLLANIGEQNFTIANFKASREFSSKVSVSVYITNDHHLGWRWVDEVTGGIIRDEQLIPLP